MDQSVFLEKGKMPEDEDLMAALADTYPLWHKIRGFVISKDDRFTEEWNYPGDKYGWSFRVKDKKRAILYFLPRDRFFRVAFVFGQKATGQILDSGVADEIKTELKSAKVYAEGRGIRIEVKNDKIIPDILRLISIKLAC